MLRKNFVVVALAGALLGTSAPGALANDQYEPNDNFAQPGTQIVGGQRYDAMIDGLGDDDYFVLTGSGQATVSVTVTSDSCPDSAYALSISFRDYDTAFSSKQVDTQIEREGSTQFDVTLEKGHEYRLGFRSNSTNHSDPPCNGPTKVDYNFTVTGAVGSGGTNTGPKTLKSKPAYRDRTCHRRSTAFTGGGPALIFKLKKNGTWVDYGFGKKTTAKWKWKKGKLTLYTKKGKKLYSFAHMQDGDAKGEKYLLEKPEPKNGDTLTCR